MVVIQEQRFVKHIFNKLGTKLGTRNINKQTSKQATKI